MTKVYIDQHTDERHLSRFALQNKYLMQLKINVKVVQDGFAFKIKEYLCEFSYVDGESSAVQMLFHSFHTYMASSLNGFLHGVSGIL